MVKILKREDVPLTEKSTGLLAHLAINKETCGTQVLSQQIVVIPPGRGAKPHKHECETAIYHIDGNEMGSIVLYVKENDRWIRHVVGPGDSVFIPPGQVHMPINKSTKPVLCVIARSSPTETCDHYSASDFDEASFLSLENASIEV